MSRVILVILVGICIYFWFRSRRGADRMIKTMTGPEAASSQDAVVPSERSAELGLLPAQKQDSRYAAAPGPEAARALAAAEAGEWEPAAELLATAAGSKDWERRALWTDLLGAAAAGSAAPDGTAPAGTAPLGTAPAWLAAWEKAREGDAGAALVRAAAEGPGAARTAALRRAKEADPADPTPYVVEMGGAVAAGVEHAELSGIFREAITRAPYLYAAHAAALRYWLPKGRGSAPLAEEFAADAAAGAPLGSLMTAFPLIAWFEEHLESTRDPEEYRTAELTGRIDRALMDAAAAPADHPRLPELRHLLAYFLYKQDRFDAALEQFRHIDGYVNALPWSYYTRQDLYMRARETTVRNAA
ncbi:hypothetical protein [Streptomyces sp. NRRL F-5126]|uniref:hypothetical protein n=1 Tax=Streptomyces sp. NRRL F-5126 TaxID=1463857 RepID=UPI00056435D0|nr:hypothetical protein [Streptomyces sp. NRRL F-5126]